MGPFRRRGPYRKSLDPPLREDVGHALDGAPDVVRKERDGTDHGERDHGEHDSVLGHRLPLLAPAQRIRACLDEGEELQHVVHLPSRLDAHASACDLPTGMVGRMNLPRPALSGLVVMRAVLTVTREKPPKSFGVAAPPFWLR